MSPSLLFVASWLTTAALKKLRLVRKERYHLPSLLYHQDNEQISNLVAANEAILKEYTFESFSGIFDYFGELQQAYFLLMRKFYPTKPEYDRELLVLGDGGTVALDFMRAPGKDDTNVPLVLLQHGLCGHTYSHYMKGLPGRLVENGMYVVSFVARGCGGVSLTTPETFTAARTADFRAVVQYLQKKYPGRKISAVGYSLGAGILLKYLGEEGSGCPLSAAVAISAAFDFHDRTPLFRKYERMGLVAGLIHLANQHKHILQNNPESFLDWEGMIGAKTIREFDQAAIVGRAPVQRRSHARFGMESHGSPDKLTGRSEDRAFLHFATVDDYYTASSSIRYTHLIQTPTLAINARDDFLAAYSSVPGELGRVGSGLCVVLTPHGGHVSFPEAPWAGHGLGSSWSDRAAAAWIRSAVDSDTHCPQENAF
jgi:predicted alpha/beta-fold hydrolase